MAAQQNNYEWNYIFPTWRPSKIIMSGTKYVTNRSLYNSV